MRAAGLQTGRGALLAPRCLGKQLAVLASRQRPCKLYAQVPPQPVLDGLRKPCSGLFGSRNEPSKGVACRAAAAAAGRNDAPPDPSAAAPAAIVCASRTAHTSGRAAPRLPPAGGGQQEEGLKLSFGLALMFVGWYGANIYFNM
jgi:hypothetical protein